MRNSGASCSVRWRTARWSKVLALPHPPQVDYRLTATGRGLADTGVYLLTALDWNEVLEQDGTAQDTGQ
jgi:DNA-binding HxlR family transcriptional regulator